MQTLTIPQGSLAMNLPLQIPSQIGPIKLKEPSAAVVRDSTKTLVPTPTTPTSLMKLPAVPLPLKKQLSEPLASVRRSIFSQFWRGRAASSSSETLAESTDTDVSNSNPPPPTRQRSKSVSSIAKTPEDARLCVEFFSPPVVRSVLNDHEHFLPLDQLNQNHLLPVLPMPLRRFYAEGKSSPLQGMYPLTEPKSILKHKDQTAESLDVSDNQLPVRGLCQQWNLTASDRHMHPIESYCNVDAEPRTVSFDPRITVTEFNDSVPREWYSEAELDRFRTQTVMRAQAYLMKHPDLIRVYQQPFLDPFTGTMRKKALYSMPCLSSAASDDDDNGSDASADMDTKHKPPSSSSFQTHRIMAQHALEVAARQQVQSILIVDRNKVCLDLFSRSLKHIFPHARIELADTAQKALTLSRKELIEKKRGFDVVIAEESVNLPLTDSATPLIRNAKSFQPTVTKAITSKNRREGLLHSRHESLEGFVEGPVPPEDTHKKVTRVAVTMTGSQLLARLAKEASMLTVASHATPQGMARPVASPFVPLLIAVSNQPEEIGIDDGNLASADLVWGKPPPFMDKQLRDAMVEKLLLKRQAAKGT